MRKRLAAAAIVSAALILLIICGAHAAEMPEEEITGEETITTIDADSLEHSREMASFLKAFKSVKAADGEITFQRKSVQEEPEPFRNVEIPEDIMAQIEIYVEQREVWLSEWENNRPNFNYAWCDLNMDGGLEMICSMVAGTGRYSESYIYAIGSSGEVELVAEISGGLGGCPDLLGWFELYADVPESGQAQEHFYIRSVDYTPDERFSYKWDMVVTFTADLTEWQVETIRRCSEEYEDVTHHKLVDADYYNSAGDSIPREEWERLGEEFPEGKELITDDLTWDVLYPLYPRADRGEKSLSDSELREALENLYFGDDDSG